MDEMISMGLNKSEITRTRVASHLQQCRTIWKTAQRDPYLPETVDLKPPKQGNTQIPHPPTNWYSPHLDRSPAVIEIPHEVVVSSGLDEQLLLRSNEELNFVLPEEDGLSACSLDKSQPHAQPLLEVARPNGETCRSGGPLCAACKCAFTNSSGPFARSPPDPFSFPSGGSTGFDYREPDFWI
jgi:hypothetical protein